MRGHTARALARGLRPPLHPRRALPHPVHVWVACALGGWVAGWGCVRGVLLPYDY